MNKQKLLILAGIFISVVGITLGGVYFWLDNKIHQANMFDGPKIVQVEKGMGVRAIGSMLESTGIIEKELFFTLHARLTESHRGLRAGEYEIASGMTIPEIMTHLSSNDTVSYGVTIPEGLTNREIVEILYDNDVLVGEVDQAYTQGILLPETYHFKRGDSRQSILDRMRAAKAALKQELWSDFLTSESAKSHPIKSWEDAITLASIVEKETALGAERPQVASVFVNRLRKGMRLQSDPTVIFALTEGQKPLGRELTRKDWRVDHPYNTYVISALPPGPIANPGKESIRAVLYPDQTDYIYFVADGSGGHAFAKTLKEHNRNVAKWRKFKKSQQ